MKHRRLIVLLFLPACLAGPFAKADAAWTEKSESTRLLMQEMDNTINLPDRNKAYDDYMRLFAGELQAYGLLESGPADLDHIKQHYKPVFENFDDGSLVTDTLVVAGNMAAQRYHSLFTLNGSFDGIYYEDKLAAIRGFTFFEFNEHNQIIRRWSNHDHAYRMGQLLGARGREQGALLSKQLNGPGLSAQKVEEQIKALVAAANQIHDPALRMAQVMSMFSQDVKAWGVAEAEAGYNGLSGYFSGIWESIPDLVVVAGDVLSAWSFGATVLTGHGTWRKNHQSHGANDIIRKLTIELIVRFDDQARIDSVYLYQHPIEGPAENPG